MRRYNEPVKVSQQKSVSEDHRKWGVREIEYEPGPKKIDGVQPDIQHPKVREMGEDYELLQEEQEQSQSSQGEPVQVICDQWQIILKGGKQKPVWGFR